MGLFDKFKNSSVTGLTFNEQEAVVAVTLLISDADGEIGEEESNVAAAAMLRMHLFSGYDIDIARVYRIMANHDAGEIISAAKNALSMELRETAFAIAVDIALADGYLDPSEQECLEDLFQGLEISEELATKIIEVIMIKNRG